MANRRMLSRSISTSKKLSKASDFSALLYTWLIPHCDDGGNMDGDPVAVRGIVVPMRDVTVQQVAEALEELKQLGLIDIYEAKDGEPFIHIIDFEKFQTLRSDRVDVRYPAYKGNGNQRETDGKPAGVANVTKHNVTEHNRTERNARVATRGASSKRRKKDELTDEDYDLAKAYLRAWNHVHGTRFSAYKPLAKNLKYWLEQYKPEDVLQAIVNVKLDNWWKDKMEPVTLLRRHNQNREEVDYIGKMLHVHGRRENVPKGARAIF